VDNYELSAMNSKPVRLLIELSAPKAQRSFRRIPLAPAPWNAALLPSFRRIPLGWLLNPAPQRLPVFTTKKLIELSVISIYYCKKSKERKDVEIKDKNAR
jgi:hypothetical protein